MKKYIFLILGLLLFNFNLYSATFTGAGITDNSIYTNAIQDNAVTPAKTNDDIVKSSQNVTFNKGNFTDDINFDSLKATVFKSSDDKKWKINISTNGVLRMYNPWEEDFESYDLGAWFPSSHTYTILAYAPETFSCYSYSIVNGFDNQSLRFNVSGTRYGDISLIKTGNVAYDGEINFQVKISTLTSTALQYGMCFRTGNYNGFWADRYAVYVNLTYVPEIEYISSVQMVIQTFANTGGGGAFLAIAPLPNPIMNTVYNIKATFNGSEIKGYLDDVEKVYVLDSSYKSGDNGFYFGYQDKVEVDNFIIK